MKTLQEWLGLPGASEHTPITTVAGRVGIHDSRAIESERWDLWNLADYRVDCVQAGVVWLVKRARPCGVAHNEAIMSDVLGDL
jgi:hypothetical protein